MTREEAIRYIDGLHYEEDFPYTDTIADFVKERNEAIDMAIEALKSVSFENDTKTKSYSKDSDLISRADAIEAMERIGSLDTEADREYARGIIKALPSADTVEVVRCKDCRHRIHDEERCLYYCKMYYGQGDVSDDNFCQWGAKMDGERSE